MLDQTLKEKGGLGFFCSVLGTFSFITFGVVGYMNLKMPWHVANLIFGALIGLLFGWFSKFLMSTVLGILNRDIKEQHGSRAVSVAVKRSTVFMFPYAVLLFLSAYFLGWASAAVFFSAAIMNTGVLAGLEISRLKGKQAVQNSIATSLTASAVSFIWMFSGGYLKPVASLFESLITLGLSLMGVKS